MRHYMRYFLYAFVWVISWLPLRVLYFLSDISFFFIYHVARYRRSVVKRNLQQSLPTYSKLKLKTTEIAFYRYFCDLFVETLYEMHIGESEMKKRMIFTNMEAVLEQYANDKSVLLMTAHFGNWEWTSSLSLWLPKDKPLYGVYQRLSNENFDTLMCELRTKCGGKNVERKELLRKMVQLKADKQLAMFGMISDQSPARSSIHYWTTFLNQPTAPVSGTEQLARKFDYPVFFGKVTRIKRGFYQCEFVPIALQPKLTAENEITELYMRMLEQNILAAPQYWLWTHRRWKHKPETAD